MVAVRSAHINKAGEFDPEKWIASLGITSQKSCECLAETWAYCLQQTQGHPDASLLLWRGVEMVEILSTLSMDIDTLRAALLFPLADANVVSEDVLRESVGKSVVNLIHGVRDMAAIRQLKATHTDSVSSEQVDNVRRMLLAMVDDFRCVVIKLAERIAHLREVKDAPEDERVLAAKECTNIYAPLANRLGIGQLKWELEDYCFRYLHPTEYKRIAKLLHERRLDREHYIEEFVGHLRAEMKAEGVKAEVYGRPKHIYSIWRKMQKKNLAFDELFDVRAVRIVAERLQDCYAALGIVHTHYRHLPDEFDDYVANPKPNGYQSIHTVVLGPGGKTVEIQIRTKQMHEDAELGVAAHWKYKEGVRGSSKDDQRLAWIRQIIESQQESNDVEEIVRAIKNDLAPEDVFAFTPKGDMITLPVGSTVIDFAYAIHTQVGHKMCGAKVDKKMVSYDYQIKTGEIIEILTTNVEGHGPSRSWLNICKTNEAKSKIRSWFKKERREENIFEGRNALEREFRRNNIRVPEEELEDFLKMDMHRHSCDTLDDFFAAIGYGGVQLSKVMQRLKSEYNKKYGEKAQPDTSDLENKIKTSKNSTGVIVDGIDNCAIKFAQCCNPLPGDEIVGFITRGHGISVHKKDCVNYLSQKDDPENAARWINVKWESSEKHTGYFKCTLDIVAVDRIGLLADVSSALAMINIFIYESTSRELKNGNAMLSVTVSIAGMEQLNNVINKLQKIKNVISVERSGK